MQDNTLKTLKTFFIILLSIASLIAGLLLSQYLSNSRYQNKVTGIQLPTDKITLVNFWATWCPPCRKEIPDFIQLHAEFKDKGFSVVGIALDNEAKVNAYATEMGINYPSLIMEAEGYALMEEYGSQHGALPYTVILDKQGNILHKHQKGILSYQQAKELIEPLL